MKRTLLFALAAFAAASIARAQSIPPIVSYQGFITQAGVPINGPVNIDLTLYNAQSGGTQIWSTTYSSVQVSKGYYTVLMDFSQNWQNGSVDFHGQYWLDATVNGADMGRVQMTGSPFAVNAILADSAIHVPQAPIGTIVAYAGQALNLPQERATGWYVCNGDSVLISDYPAYAQGIGSIYGTSEDGNYVYLPDFRGLFLRGVNGSRRDSLADPDAASRTALNGHGLAGNQIGSVQLDALKNHFHYISGRTSGGGAGSWSYQYSTSGGAAGGWFADPPNQPASGGQYMGGTQSNGESSESRPKNAYVYWLIKVR